MSDRKVGDTLFGFTVEGEPGQARLTGYQTVGEFDRFVHMLVRLNPRLAFEVEGKGVFRGYGPGLGADGR